MIILIFIISIISIIIQRKEFYLNGLLNSDSTEDSFSCVVNVMEHNKFCSNRQKSAQPLAYCPRLYPKFKTCFDSMSYIRVSVVKTKMNYYCCCFCLEHSHLFCSNTYCFEYLQSMYCFCYPYTLLCNYY